MEQASTLIASELTNSPNQNFGIWKHGDKGETWGSMVKNGGEMGEGGHPRSRRGNVGTTSKVGETWGKRGEKWDGIPIFHSPISPIFLEVRGLCHT